MEQLTGACGKCCVSLPEFGLPSLTIGIPLRCRRRRTGYCSMRPQGASPATPAGIYSSTVSLAIVNSSWSDEPQLQAIDMPRKSFVVNSDRRACLQLSSHCSHGPLAYMPCSVSRPGALWLSFRVTCGAQCLLRTPCLRIRAPDRLGASGEG